MGRVSSGGGGTGGAAAAIASAVRWASAMVEIIGFTPVAVGSALASPMCTPGVSVQLAPGVRDRGARVVAHATALIWWAETATRRPERDALHGGDERLQVLTAAPAARPRRTGRSRPRPRPHGCGSRGDRGAGHAEVDLVLERVVHIRIAPRRCRPCVAAVALQPDQPCGVSEPRHRRLVLGCRAADAPAMIDGAHCALSMEEAVTGLDFANSSTSALIGAPHQARCSG